MQKVYKRKTNVSSSHMTNGSNMLELHWEIISFFKYVGTKKANMLNSGCRKWAGAHDVNKNPAQYPTMEGKLVPPTKIPTHGPCDNFLTLSYMCTYPLTNWHAHKVIYYSTVCNNKRLGTTQLTATGLSLNKSWHISTKIYHAFVK
jgi:hypothetical protein